MSPSWKHRPSTLPLSSHITQQELVGVLLWYLMYIPLVMVPPERLQRPFIVSSIAFGATSIGLLAWAVPKAGGGGPLFKTVNTASSTPFSMMLGITSILGSWGSGTIGQSDWVSARCALVGVCAECQVRYSKRRYYPLLSQLVAAPVMITICALVGVVVTSASSEILGEIIWSPIALLSQW
jgi:NCS1 family nucleobase:cation symporter-1